ncbi:flagellar hook-associated protein FlgL [Agarivorans sp. 1_MG-2023]|uniref:flagellar hook-associated protein FlgL n=1 Tax=Agarivorans sp. 1_MG-2023 TaxID=3062634 RepID=UPI0026E46D2B|nr:flagellar hook-associated protein FlgL [Agarivorans sp. 1_MG-2023]MDO6763938.1 flagellar hook-associated protein FlgL [Agarivorans sp. 1_MG-2023]
MRVSSINLYQSSLNGVLNSQQQVEKMNQHLITNKKLLTAADGPSDMSKTMFLTTEITLTEQHLKNGTLLENALNFEESTLDGMINAMQRARVLGVQSGDGLNGEAERKSLAQELRQIQAQMVDFMNSQNADGSYVFSGFQTQKQPYVFDGTDYNYQGDAGVNELKVSSSVYIQSNDTGQEVFDNVFKRFVTNDLSGNINTTITDQRAYDSFHKLNYDPITPANNTYQVQTTAGAPDTYEILDSGGASLVPPETGDYVPGQSINFNGVDINISTPAGSANESFELAPPDKDNVLNMLSEYIVALEDPSLVGDAYVEKQSDFLVGLDNSLESVNLTLGSIGARGNSLEAVRSAASSMDLINQKSRASLSEVDFAEAVSNLQKAELALNTSYSSYSRISQLSLFNYL